MANCSFKLVTSHWQLPPNVTEEDVSTYEGFIYEITNTITGQIYIGKKFIWSRRTLKQSGTTRRKHVRQESNWRTYTGSCDQLNRDIQKQGKMTFEFKILRLLKTRTGANYYETKEQMDRDVLDARDNNGNFIYYNKNISLKYFRHNIY